jgi:DNA polymerase III subunit delta'
MMIFPWQEAQWQYLCETQKLKRLPHALLFFGAVGTGIKEFTQCFLQQLLCDSLSLDGAYCLSVNRPPCQACRFIIQGTHSSVHWVTPDSARREIKVDQIRFVQDFIYQSSLNGDYCIVVIHPADSMNHHAANALLKMLEEPPPQSFFILIAHQLSFLPITIRSRCQKIFFPLPLEQDALSWLRTQLKQPLPSPALLLKIANGAPLIAATLTENNFKHRALLFEGLDLLGVSKKDPLQIADSLQEIDFVFLIDMIYTWFLDILRLKFKIQSVINEDYRKQLALPAALISEQGIIQFTYFLERIRKFILQGISLNKLLLLENILIRYFALVESNR